VEFFKKITKAFSQPNFKVDLRTAGWLVKAAALVGDP
jgi:hypothetical protein